MIVLSSTNYLSEGNDRVCYNHPDAKEKVIKISKSKRNSKKQNLLDYSYFKFLEKKKTDFSQISKCNKWVDTNLGRGLVCDKIINFDNTPSKTFEEVVLNNDLDEEVELILLEQLKNYIFQNNILFIDVSLSNLMLKKINKNEFILIIIDGLGARRYGIKFYLQRTINILTKRKIKKQWNKLISNYKNLKKDNNK